MIPNVLLAVPKRYYVLLLLFVVNSFYALLNTSILVVDLTSNKTIKHADGSTEIKDAQYRWTSSEVGLILSMNAVGHFFSSFTGIIVSRLGGVTSLGIAKMLETVMSLTAPLAISTHLYLFVANRFALGFAEGFSGISYMDVYTHWVPSNERVRFVNYAHLGHALGGAVSPSVSGFIIQNFGWKQLLYLSGFLTLFWNAIWILCVSNDPSTDKFITEKERMYLRQEIKHVSREKIRIPYRNIFTSITTYALMNEFFVSMFTSTFMWHLLPLYVKDVYNADVQTIGLISGIPEVSAFVTRPLFAYIADYLRSKPDRYSIGKVHKSFLFWGQSLTVCFFFIAAMWNNLTGCIICLTLARISFGISQISYYVIPIDVFGRYAAFMQSIIVLFLSTAHFLNPLVVGLIVPNHSQSEWNIYFIFISSLTMYAVIVFVFFGSGDLQPWAKVSDKAVEEKTETGGT